MPKLAASPAAHNFSTCPLGCGRRVVRAMYRGQWISVETVAWGFGDLGLTRDLITGNLTADRVGRHQSSYRRHDCPKSPKTFRRCLGVIDLRGPGGES